MQICVHGHVGVFFELPVLVSLGIYCDLFSGQFSGLLGTVLVRLDVCRGSLLWPCFRSAGISVLVMLHFSLKSLWWSCLRSKCALCLGQFGVSHGCYWHLECTRVSLVRFGACCSLLAGRWYA